MKGRRRGLPPFKQSPGHGRTSTVRSAVGFHGSDQVVFKPISDALDEPILEVTIEKALERPHPARNNNWTAERLFRSGLATLLWNRNGITETIHILDQEEARSVQT